jgi:hypothetical protein
MKTEPELIIHMTQSGVTKTRIRFTTLAEEQAGRELQARCASIIALLSRAARGAKVPAPAGLPIELPQEAVITHASNQPHHPRS